MENLCYRYNLVKIKVNWNFEDADKSFTQTIIIEKVINSPPEVRISIEPKVSGHSAYETYTSVTSNGYKNVLDYYKNSFRSYHYMIDPGLIDINNIFISLFLSNIP